ncbi:MAG: TonB-dependent receptor [Acidobacteria bacterium]|nr:TonB-dependent receptor [Acidobacteriota bacterium]
MTLNLGVRYELYTQPVDARDRGSLFDLKTGRFQLPGEGGFSRAIVDGDHNNLGPRFGFAYQQSQKLVIRGGYGMFYGLRDQNQETSQFSGNNPNVPSLTFPIVDAQRTIAPPFNTIVRSSPRPAIHRSPAFPPHARLSARSARRSSMARRCRCCIRPTLASSGSRAPTGCSKQRSPPHAAATWPPRFCTAIKCRLNLRSTAATRRPTARSHTSTARYPRWTRRERPAITPSISKWKSGTAADCASW